MQIQPVGRLRVGLRWVHRQLCGHAVFHRRPRADLPCIYRPFGCSVQLRPRAKQLLVSFRYPQVPNRAPQAVGQCGQSVRIWPSFGTLDAILANYAPPPGTGTLNPETADSSNVLIRDYDASNKSLVDAMAELLEYGGFILNFRTTQDPDGLPQTTAEILRRDAFAAIAPKPVFLAPAGAGANPAANNVATLHLARDCNSIANAWYVETQLRQVEITVYLAPGYIPSAGDETSTNIGQWFSSNLTNAVAAQRRQYRWYVADECGDGHFNNVAQATSNASLDLSPVFPLDEFGNPLYVQRYRPGSRTLIAKDAQGKPLKAVLEIAPGVVSGEPFVAGDLNSATHRLDLVHDPTRLAALGRSAGDRIDD